MTHMTRSRQASATLAEMDKKSSVPKKGTEKKGNEQSKKVPFKSDNNITTRNTRSKVNAVGNENTLVKGTVPGMKSPVFRDRTNVHNQNVSKNDKVSNKNKKVVDQKNCSDNSNKNNEVKIADLDDLDVDSSSILAKLKKTTSMAAKNSNGIPSKNNSLKNQKESKKVNTSSKKVGRRKNISQDVLERLLLNEDDENDGSLLNDQIDNNQPPIEEQLSNLQDKNKEENIPKKSNKKFFKTKDGKETTRPTIKMKKTSQKKTKVAKKIKEEDSMGLEIDTVRDCLLPLEKNLRFKVPINYCELSKLSQDSNLIQNEAEKDKQLPNLENNQKNVPIYKTIRLSQEKNENDNKDAVYEFFFDSPEKKKVKKKKPIRKPATKRIKKTTKSRVKKNLKMKNKSVNIEKVKENDNALLQNSLENFPENCDNLGESTIQEHPTIKIISIEKLDSNKIELVSTPKTISFNNSLINKSLSPIKKITENFDSGSPWRPIDNFCRVKKMVQSTPHINKQSLKSNILLQKENPLGKKSIHSQSTIHLSATENSIFKENSMCLSPRKFGTEISNSSSGKSSSSASSRNSSRQNQASTSKASFEELKDQEDIPMIPAFANKENISPRRSKSPRKKCTTSCPSQLELIETPKTLELKSPEKETKESRSEVISSNIETIKNLKQTNLNAFLNLEEMPESTSISTPHGIFDDLCSSPITGKKQIKPIEEPNIDNAFGFDDGIDEELLTIRTDPVAKKIDRKDIVKNVKGKLFPKARVKSSALPTRASENTIKQTLLKNVLHKLTPEELKSVKATSDSEESDQNMDETLNLESRVDDSKLKKKAVLDSISFSDTFDLLAENQDLESKVPEEVPLFVDLEPAHFTEPPRRSYQKRKRAVSFNNNNFFDSNDDDSDDEEEKRRKKKSKTKKKKESKVSKEQQKKIQEWVKNINSTFDEIDHFDLVVE